MGKTLKSTCKMCRREGVSLCGKERCALKRRPFPPGVHGPTQKKPRLSSFGIQLREKQKAKRLYNLMERQFRNYFKKATVTKGDTGKKLTQLLERRLDNVVFRLGFAKTRRQARQIVGHGFIEVNGKKVDIPSFSVRVGDTVKIREGKKGKMLVQEITARLEKQEVPGWLTLDAATQTGKMTSDPEGADLKNIFDPKLIIEFYSRT